MIVTDQKGYNMKKVIGKTSLFLLFMLCMSLCAAPLKLDHTMSISLDIPNPTPAEKTAIEELNTYLQRIFGYYAEKRNGVKLILRYNAAMGEEQFRITAKGKQIVIEGGRPRGVLYGAYYFLDRKLGVHWFTPYDEYVPEYDSKELEEFTYNGKPAIRIRMELIYTDKYQIRYAARNLLNRSANNMIPDAKYGESRVFSPPLNCHGMHYIIPAHKYNLRNHPEFFALINGKRVNPEIAGGSTDYCLTNPGLIAATVKEARNYLKKAPDAKYISIQEGDGTRGTCHCKTCQDLVNKCGKRESARWIYFANAVGKELNKEFPNVKFLVFAYTASRLAPSNIKAEDYVAVQFCSWGARRGLPYAHPKNKGGREMLKQIQDWLKVCKNILMWDYTYTFGNLWFQQPDMLLNIDNMKSFAELGVDGVFCEDHELRNTNVHFGYQFRNWLLARAMWNPDECNGEELEQMFCREFYGKKAGKYIATYWKLLRDTNRKQGFSEFTPGGSLGKADFEQPATTIKSMKLMEQALNAVKTDERIYRRRVYEAFIPLKFRMIMDYAKLKSMGVMGDLTPKGMVQELRQYIRGKSKGPGTWARYKMIHRNLNTLEGTAEINASASRVYGAGYVAKAYDKSIDLGSNWHSGTSTAWSQIDFGEKRPINRITTVFAKYPVVIGGDYTVQGSFDGKSWYTMIPRQKFKADPGKLWVYTDIQLPEPIEARFIRTHIYRLNTIIQGKVRVQDVIMQEQFYNLQELPQDLLQTRKQ